MTKVFEVSYCEDCPFMRSESIHGLDDSFLLKCGHEDVPKHEGNIVKKKNLHTPLDVCPLQDKDEYVEENWLQTGY